MPKKSIDQLKKEIKEAEKEKERRRLEDKLKSLKGPSKIRKFIPSKKTRSVIARRITPSKKTRSRIAASLNRASREFGF